MLKKVVVFDSGFGGELFADFIEAEIPILDVIRVIDWRNSELLIKNPKAARAIAEAALRPYINRVEVIVFANFLLSVDLKYFQRKYKTQKFIGFPLKTNYHGSAPALILTTKALHCSLSYRLFTHRLKCKVKTVDCDSWPELIDDGELTNDSIRTKLEKYKALEPRFIFLACTQFSDIKPNLTAIFSPTAKIEDHYRTVLKSLCKAPALRGLDGRKSS